MRMSDEHSSYWVIKVLFQVFTQIMFSYVIFIMETLLNSLFLGFNFQAFVCDKKSKKTSCYYCIWFFYTEYSNVMSQIFFSYIIISRELSCIPTSDRCSISPSLKSVFGLEYPNWSAWYLMYLLATST